MKATMQFGPEMIALVIFMIGIFGGSYYLIGSMTEVTSGLTEPSYAKLSSIDASYQAISCLSEKNVITPESIKNNIENCRAKTKLDYLDIQDIQTKTSYISGSSGRGTEYTSYSNMQVDGENHQIRIYVKKS